MERSAPSRLPSPPRQRARPVRPAAGREAPLPDSIVPDLAPAPAQLLRLQRSVGNRAIARLLAAERRRAGRSAAAVVQRGPLDDLKSWRAGRRQQDARSTGLGLRDAARGGDTAALDTRGEGRSGAVADIISGAGAAAGTAGDVSGIADSTLLTLSTTPTSFGTGEKLIIAGSEGMSGEVNAASAGVGMGTAGLAGFASFLGLVDAVRVATDKQKSARERTMGGIAAAENLAQGGISAGQLAGSAVGSAAGFTGAGVMGDISTGAVELLGGVGDAIAQAFATGKGLVTLIWDVVLAFKGKKDWTAVLKENGGAMLSGLLPALKRFLGMAKSVLSGVRWILKAVETGGEFVQAFPLIGNSIGIFIKLISVVEETIKMVVEAVRVGKAGRMIHQLSQSGAMQLAAAGNVLKINWKRVRRHLIPVFTNAGRVIGDFVGISGNVLQIVGVASSAAYGAGVGLMAGGIAASAGGSLFKVGMGATELGFKATRWTKQAGRDLAAAREGKDLARGIQGEERGRFGRALSWTFNTQKTTATKDAQYRRDAQAILTNLAQLPPVGGNQQQQADILEKDYRPLLVLVKATGVNLKDLKRQASLDDMHKLLVAAMKRR